MKVSIKRIRSVDMESFIGRMERYIKVSGRMGNSMARVKFMTQMETSKQGNGLMVKKVDYICNHFYFFFFYSFLIIFYMYF